ncbi:MAG: putative two-component system response regulator [Deltaproteobacteria bacterium]|nr:putative two-component system response regulator [Deltaproteobacteria bacterium]
MPVGEETDLRVTLPDGTRLALFARVAHMLTPSAARALGRHAGMGFELIGPDTPARLTLRAHMDSLSTEITNPGLTSATQIIIVEPSPPLRTRMARSLEAAGFKVTAVESATEALQVCSEWRPDAMVSAADMVGMTGMDLAYAMSEHSTLSDVPLVLTGDDGDLGRLEAFRAGVRDYVPRPFLDEELVIRVHRIAAPAPASNLGLRGSIGDISIPTLLSLFEFERKSGVLLLLDQGQIARIFVAEGRCIKVESSGSNGATRPKERLMMLLDWQEGEFEFSPASIGGRDEIGVTITQLLLEHARHSDESKPHSRL